MAVLCLEVAILEGVASAVCSAAVALTLKERLCTFAPGS